MSGQPVISVPTNELSHIEPTSMKGINAGSNLTKNQYLIWLEQKLNPDVPMYNMFMTFAITGEIQLVHFRKAFQALVDQSDALRMVVEEVDNIPQQRIILHFPYEMDFLDFSEGTEPLAAIESFLQQRCIIQFDLSERMFDSVLIKFAADKYCWYLNVHHLIVDGWSFSLLYRRMAEYYGRSLRGQLADISPLPSFEGYILSERAYRNSTQYERAEAYWQEKLAQRLEPINFYGQGLSQYVTSNQDVKNGLSAGRVKRVSYPLGIERTKKIKELAQSGDYHFLTPDLSQFAIFATALFSYLYRLSENRHLSIGVPFHNRSNSLAKQTIGLLMEVCPQQIEISQDDTFQAVFKKVTSELQETLPHFRFGAGNPTHNKVYDVMLNYVKGTYPEFDGSPVVPQWRLSGYWNGNSSLFIQVHDFEDADNFDIHFDFLTAVFDERLQQQTIAHFMQVLDSLLLEPNQIVSRLSLLTEQDRYQLLVQWNDTQKDYPKNKSFHQLFEEQVEQSPDAVALVFEDKQLTYRELNNKANQLAHYLQAQGVGPEVVVGISMERSLEMVLGLIGVLKAGGAYVALDPTYPKERLAFMLSDSQIPILLTQQHLIVQLPKHETHLICIDREWQSISRESERNPTNNVMPNNLAYIIYTSGSTGKPKGTLVEHRGIGNLAQAQIEAFDVRADSRVLQFASFSFDAAISEVAMALLAGATLVLATQDSLMPGANLSSLLHNQGITTVTLPPAALAVMSDENFPELRTVVSAGEACSADIAARWAAGRRFLNAYGPAEATVCATFAKINNGHQSPPIGRPIANTQVYILDQYLEPVPVGLPGELHIGGVGLARGYLNRPKLTAEKFIPNPFSSEPDARLYRTGDLARFLPSGDIEFLGRVDHQVKIRGFRIELGEIETVLEQYPAVSKALVIARDNHQGDTSLAAYLVSTQAPVSESGDALHSKTPSMVAGNNIELWPSVAEYYIYDELLYSAMTNDDRRNNSYKVAINQFVKDKIVVDIGTGKDAILSRFCVEAGAKKVYALELLEETYNQAKETIKTLGYEDKIKLIHGDSTKVQLPEKVDVCVSEIVGAIGGAEGAAVILNDARRFLKEDGLMIPERSDTKIAVVSLPDEFLNDPAFTNLSAYYVKKTFDQIGHMFDLRLALKGVTNSNLISTIDTFESLDFTGYVEAEYSQELTLTITKDGRMDGFLVWLNLHTMSGEVIDILEHEHSWLPVYFPVFYPGIEVSRGDSIKAVVRGRFCDNNLNLDYQIEGQLFKKSGEVIDFDYTSYHYKNSYKNNAFYNLLFAEDTIKVIDEGTRILSRKNLREYLKRYLPEYMVPSDFVFLEEFPLSPNGKVDRKALPLPDRMQPDLEANYVAPQGETEKIIAIIWQDLLNLEKVSTADNFFDLGGHSLLVAQAHRRLGEKLNIEIPMVKLFQYSTISSLADYLNKQQDESLSRREIRGRAARQKEAFARRKNLKGKVERTGE